MKQIEYFMSCNSSRMKENFVTCCTALVLYFYHQENIMEVGMGNCKTEVAPAKVHQLLWLLPLMENQSVYYKQYCKILPMHLFSCSSNSKGKKQISPLLAPPGKNFGKFPYWSLPGKNPSHAHVLDSITENLELIEPHQAFFILKNCLSIPKLTYLLRSAPCFKCLETFDTTIKINTEKICNVTFGKDSWSQASLPIRHGELRLRSAADLSLPCFLSSSFACQGLVNRLLLSLKSLNGEVISATDAWSALHDLSPLRKEIQSAWDYLACRDSLTALLNTSSPWNHCRLLTAQKSHTVAWSEAFPIASVGNLLSPDELRIAIAFRTGAKVFESTECRCDKIVDKLGLHGPCCGPLSQTLIHQLHPLKAIDPHWSPLCLGTPWLD